MPPVCGECNRKVREISYTQYSYGHIFHNLCIMKYPGCIPMRGIIKGSCPICYHEHCRICTDCVSLSVAVRTNAICNHAFHPRCVKDMLHLTIETEALDAVRYTCPVCGDHRHTTENLENLNVLVSVDGLSTTVSTQVGKQPETSTQTNVFSEKLEAMQITQDELRAKVAAMKVAQEELRTEAVDTQVAQNTLWMEAAAMQVAKDEFKAEVAAMKVAQEELRAEAVAMQVAANDELKADVAAMKLAQEELRAEAAVQGTRLADLKDGSLQGRPPRLSAVRKAKHCSGREDGKEEARECCAKDSARAGYSHAVRGPHRCKHEYGPTVGDGYQSSIPIIFTNRGTFVGVVVNCWKNSSSAH